MLTEDLVRRYNKAWQAAWNEGKVDALDEFVSPNLVRHIPPFPDIIGLEAYKKSILDARAAHPDQHVTMEEGAWAYRGNRLFAHGMFRGTLTGPSIIPGMPSLGQKLEFAWCNAERWDGGKLVEQWALNDYLGMMYQLGLVLKPKEG